MTSRLLVRPGLPYAETNETYRRMVVDASANDILYSDAFTGHHANFLVPKIRAAALDPDDPPAPALIAAKTWRDILSAGQGFGPITAVESAHAIVARIAAEYHEAITMLST